MKFLLLALLVTSCANIQHLTNGNLRDIQGLSTNAGLRQKYDAVNEITAAEAAKCKSKGKIKARDNALDQGERYALLYLKGQAIEVHGDSIVVEKKTKVGDYGWEMEGEAFLCAPLIAPTKDAE